MQFLFPNHSTAPSRIGFLVATIRTALAVLYNNESARLQREFNGRYIGMVTVPWDDIAASVAELERARGLGLRAVQIKGSYLDRNLDDPALFPFWEAVNDLDLTCLVHNTTQGCNQTIADHDTTYPMVGTERYHRLHLGTYLGFGIDYAVAATCLSVGGVLDQFPNLRFVFYEAGATWMSYAMLGADRAFYIEPNCARTKQRPSELIKKHCMTAVESLEPLEELVSAYGSENYIIGTDFPHPEFKYLPNATSDITDKPRLQIQPYDSHGYLHIGNMAAVAAVLAGEVLASKTWLMDALPLYLSLTNPWGGDDGGYGNGMNYALYDVQFSFLHWDMLRESLGIDVARKAWVRNFGLLMTYMQQIGRAHV